MTISDLGVQLDVGFFVSRIQPGSQAAREGGIAVGDRVVSVSRIALFDNMCVISILSAVPFYYYQEFILLSHFFHNT